MLFLKVKDFKNRKKYNKIEKKNLIKKYVIINLLSRLLEQYKTSNERRCFSLLIGQHKFKRLNKTKIVRRCILTNRSRAIIRPYNISRLAFKRLVKFGSLPGFKKAVW